MKHALHPLRYLLWVVWVILAIVGAHGVYERLFHGHEAAGYGSYVVWGLWVSGYIYYIGLSAGAFLLSSMIYVFGVHKLERIGKLSLMVAVITLCMALTAIFFDLGREWRFTNVFTRPNFTSMMAWMVWLYTCYFLVLLTELWLALRPDFARWSSEPGFRGKLGAILSLNKGPLNVPYEKTTLFAGYPAKRNWYPLSSDIYEEIVPSIDDAYPYPIKALFFYMGAPTYALPAGHTNIPVLADVKKLPLLIASDIVVGVSSMYADYIFPDLDYLERWEFHGSHPNMPAKVEPVRQPVAVPTAEIVTVYGQQMPISLESTMMAISEKLGLKCFGKDALGEGKHLNHPDDFYVRAVANIAAGTAPDGSQSVPDASPEEIEIFRKARKHLPAAVFDEQRWKNAVGEALWPKVVHLLNRGGRYENHEDTFKGPMLAHPYGKMLNLYQEKTAGVIHSGTGKKHFGAAQYLPIADYHGNEPTAMREGHPLHLITNRTISQTKSRTCTNYWLQPLMPENGIIMNAADASAQGLEHGDEVRVVSASNPEGVWNFHNGKTKEMLGKVIVTQGIRPGVVSFALGFANWATGATDVTIDGQLIKGDPRRGKGIHANAAMWVDPALKNTCMLDPVGGSVSFYDTSVKLIKTGRKATHAEKVALRAL